MIDEADIHRLDDLFRRFESGDEQLALEGLRNWASGIEDPWDKVELIYHETLFLVEMQNAREARQRLEDLKVKLASLVNSPSDGDELDRQISLPMQTRYAEIRVTTEEKREIEALQLIEDLVSCYPKQLALTEFKALAEAVGTLRGFLLGNAGRWEDARTVLEDTRPPEAWKGQYSHYLGRCYYEAREYEKARNRLLEALSFGLDASVEGRVHYVLGLVEYHLSNMKAAKHQFELSVKTADPAYLGEKIWEWLEATSRALGLRSEAENYRRMRTDLPSKSPIN